MARSRARNDALGSAGGADRKKALANEPARGDVVDFEEDGGGALKIAGDCPLANAGAGTRGKADDGSPGKAGAGTVWWTGAGRRGNAGARTSWPTATDVLGEKLGRALRTAGIADGPKVGLTMGETDGVACREIMCAGEPETIGGRALRIFGDVPRPTVAVVVMARMGAETLEIRGGATFMAWSKERARATGPGAPPRPGIKGDLVVTALGRLAVVRARSGHFDRKAGENGTNRGRRPRGSSERRTVFAPGGTALVGAPRGSRVMAEGWNKDGVPSKTPDLLGHIRYSRP